MDQAGDVDPFVQQAKAVLDLSCLRLENTSSGQTFRSSAFNTPSFQSRLRKSEAGHTMRLIGLHIRGCVCGNPLRNLLSIIGLDQGT